MEHVAQALRICEKVAQTIPIPLLGSVIFVALQIVETVEVRYTSSTFRTDHYIYL